MQRRAGVLADRGVDALRRGRARREPEARAEEVEPPEERRRRAAARDARRGERGRGRAREDAALPAFDAPEAEEGGEEDEPAWAMIRTTICTDDERRAYRRS